MKQFQLDQSIVKALQKLGYKTPTPIQKKAISKLLQKKNLIMQAQTGSGKTLAYLAPLLSDVDWEKSTCQILILSPTRELSFQIKEEVEAIGIYKRIRCVALVGKQPMKFQLQDLKQKTHVVCGSVGRIEEHLRQHTLEIDKVKYVVVDEVDEMIQDGFLNGLKYILQQVPSSCHFCFCSATMKKEVLDFYQTLQQEQVYEIIQDESKEFGNYTIESYDVTHYDKVNFTLQLLAHIPFQNVILFLNTQEHVVQFYQALKTYQLPVAYLHGGLSQEKRIQEWERFCFKDANILVASDLASRGLDMQYIDLVIHVEMPLSWERFLHRCGRSSRYLQQGRVVVYMDQNIQQKEIIPQDKTIVIKENSICFYEHIEDAIEKIKQYVSKSKKKQQKKKAFQEDVTTLYLYAGKQKKLHAKDIVGAICQIEDVNAKDIGVIQVETYGSYIEILNGKGSIVYAYLQSHTIKGKKIKVEYSTKKSFL